MKKAAIIILFLAIIFIAGIFFFIPDKFTVQSALSFSGTSAATNRVLTQRENWEKIGTASHLNWLDDQNKFVYKNDTFFIRKFLHNTINIEVANGKIKQESLLHIISINQNTVALQWSFTTLNSKNPFVRIEMYNQVLKTKKNMGDILKTLKEYLSKTENIYGIEISTATNNDTLLISSKNTVLNPPTTDDIYNLVKKLQTYAKQMNVIQNNPLLNITAVNNQTYNIEVALPVSRILPGSNDIESKQMIRSTFLSSTVKGGDRTITNVLNQIQQYIEDYQLTAMAIPFQKLITDRTQTTDTSKWITKIYFPVM